MGLEGKVKFVGRVPRTELGRHYLEADVLCVPSDSDPLPTVVLEAFCAGLPVIGAATGGIPAMVTSDRGFLFEPGNSVELAKILGSLVTNKATLEEMSRRCSIAALEEFSWTAITPELFSLIKLAVQRSRR
jgi:D-inositol-3-phosphate glycosyltransferase